MRKEKAETQSSLNSEQAHTCIIASPRSSYPASLCFRGVRNPENLAVQTVLLNNTIEMTFSCLAIYKFHCFQLP